MDTEASYWMVSGELPEHPPLAADVEVDVAVVGGGIAGISVGHQLLRAGRSVMLLEADRVAGGVTGHTTAKVSALHGAIYARLTSTLGADAARDYATSQTLAMEHVAEVTDELDLDCELERRPAFVWGEQEPETTTLRQEADAARRAGLPASFTTDTGLPFPTVGAVRVEDQLMFHPRRYLGGVLADVVARGGLVHEHTRVTDLHEGTPNVLTCADGQRVTAKDVVVTTHYPVFDRSMLFARLTPSREFAVAGVVDAEHDPPGMYINAGGDTRSIRSAPYQDRRLLIATGAPFTPGDADAPERLAELSEWLCSRFPVDGVAHTWAAQDNHTGDQVPFIGRLHPAADHSWVATGFGGWGMTNGVLAGLLLTGLVTGQRPPWAGLYDTRRLHPGLEAKTVLKSGVRTIAGLAASRAQAAARSVSVPSEIPPGHAGVVEDADGRWATYVDEDGLAHCVSSVCTHMGCLVEFNHAEREWECPCHGSRFGLDGTVKQGPATHPLRPRPDWP